MSEFWIVAGLALGAIIAIIWLDRSLKLDAVWDW